MAGLRIPTETNSIFVHRSSPWPPQLRQTPQRSSFLTLTRRVVAQQQSSSPATKLVTFLGKGGSGKTIASLIAAHYYASKGLRTCLVLQSQEHSADHLLGCNISNLPTSFCDGALDVLRLESTKLLLDPLVQLKKADKRLNFSQGALDEVVGEELSVLPGMDGPLALGAMEEYIGFAGDSVKGRKANKAYDIVVYDGLSSEETLRLFGAAEKSRWYLQRARDLAEKTDTGRVTSPSIMRLLEASVTQDSGETNGRTIPELWDGADRVLERIAKTFTDPKRFACYLVMNPRNEFSVSAALRYWGCAMQAGAFVSGAFYADIETESQLLNTFEEKFSPLGITSLPQLTLNSKFDWATAVGSLNEDAKTLLGKDQSSGIPAPVEFNVNEKKVAFFLPGFDKSEIKLSQWRGGSALLIEVGDQRRVVQLPTSLRGKVGGAKFEGKSLIVTMKAR